MPNVIVPFLLGALLVDTGLILFALSRRDRSRSLYFASLCCSLFVYTLGYLIEVMSTERQAVIAALRVENYGIPLLAPLFLLTTISLFWPKRVKPWMLLPVVVYGFFFFIIVLFNGQHHLYYTSVEMVPYESWAYVALGRGPLYVVQQTVGMGAMLVAYAIIFVRFMRGSKKLRQQMAYLVVGSIFGVVANVLNFTGVMPAGLDPTPFALAVGLLFFSVTLFRDNLMDVVLNAYNNAIEVMDDALLVLDNDASFLACNRSARALFPALESFLGAEPITRLEGWPQALYSITCEGEVEFLRPGPKEGQLRHYSACKRKIAGRRGKQTGWSVQIRDMTDMKQLVRSLEEMATTDPLTGIFNRRHFKEVAVRELEHARRRGEPVGLIMYDLDWFKRVNDTHGHYAGDLALCATVNGIRLRLREYDVFGRIGGEEFVVLTTGCGADDLNGFATRLRQVVEDIELVHKGSVIRLTASFGVVEVPAGMELEEAMQLADKAMYAAKMNGRNCVVMGPVAS